MCLNCDMGWEILSCHDSEYLDQNFRYVLCSDVKEVVGFAEKSWNNSTMACGVKDWRIYIISTRTLVLQLCNTHFSTFARKAAEVLFYIFFSKSLQSQIYYCNKFL